MDLLLLVEITMALGSCKYHLVSYFMIMCINLFRVYCFFLFFYFFQIMQVKCFDHCYIIVLVSEPQMGCCFSWSSWHAKDFFGYIHHSGISFSL